MCKFKPLASGHHSHTDSSLDGGSTSSAKIIRAAKLGRIADVVTDHGVMSAVVGHWNASKKLFKDKKIDKPIQSIHGIEVYVIDEDRPPKVYKNGKVEPKYYHLTIHFKTKQGYEYFCRLTPIMEARAITKFGERKPLLKFEELEPIAGQISISSGCLVGPVQKNILAGRSDLAEKHYLRLRALAGPGNFFCEVFPHIIDKEWRAPKRDKLGRIAVPGFFDNVTLRRDEGAIDPDPCREGLDIQKMGNEFVIAMATKHNDPIVISLDDHYAEEEDRSVQECRLNNGTENWKFYGSYSSYDSDKCAEMLQKQLNVSDYQIEQWIDNSYKFADLFSGYTLDTSKDRLLLPSIEMIYGSKEKTTRDKLNELVITHNRMPSVLSTEYTTYKERFDYELSVLADNGVADFLPYFFVLEDLKAFAKDNNIMMNVRGSASGSLILYLIGVSITDPIKYDLPFERFLTLDRIRANSLPDVDADFQDRDPIIAYFQRKYGDRAALISTDLKLRLKSSIKDVERSELGRVRPETDLMTKIMKPAPQGVSDEQFLYGYSDQTTGERMPGYLDSSDQGAILLKEYIDLNPKIWSIIKKCIGITKTRGVHAGGVVLTPEPIQNYMPVVKTDKGVATAYNMKDVEAIGGIKYDILGVTTLKAIGIALKSIEEHTGRKIEWGEFEHDSKVYEEVIAKDRLEAIFQLNTHTARPYVKQIGPRSILDISNITALCRPGSLDAPSPRPNAPEGETASEYYVKCSRGEAEPYYIHEDLRPILGDTFGIVIFQEQSLKIFRDLAGYTYATAEVVRRAIGKKDRELLDLHLGILKVKCAERGWNDQQIQLLVETLMKSANYSFNKSHAVSYAIVAYNGCFLKHHHTVHFWKGELTVHSDDHEKIHEYMKECKDLLLPVDVTKSDSTEWLIEGNMLRPPLLLIKGVGEKNAQIIRDLIQKSISDIGNIMGEDEDAVG